MRQLHSITALSTIILGLILCAAISPGRGFDVTPDEWMGEWHTNNSVGNMTGGFYYSFNLNNGSFPQWEFHDEYQWWQVFWLNNGTTDSWVMVVIDVNQTTNQTGRSDSLNFQVFDDADASVIEGWEDDVEVMDTWTSDPYDDTYWEGAKTTELGTDISGGNGFDGELEESTPPDSKYAEVEPTMNGDEGVWFLNVFFEQWYNEYSGSYTYTWYNIAFDELGNIVPGSQLDPFQLGPAISPPTTYPWGDPTIPVEPVENLGIAQEDPIYWNDSDWLWAQQMLENQSYDHVAYSWIWFSYNLGQFVSFFDEEMDQYSFLSSDISYTGMSIYNDTNTNGIVDVTYAPPTSIEGGEEIGITSPLFDASYPGTDTTSVDGEDMVHSYTPIASELLYYLTFVDVGDVTWGEPQITSTDANFWICLHEIEMLAIPFASNYQMGLLQENVAESNESISSLSCFTQYLNISFTFTTGKDQSSFSIKHDLAEFTESPEGQRCAEFDGLSLTLDYLVSETQSSSHVRWDDPVESPELSEAVSVDGLVEVDYAEDNTSTEEINLMLMNFSMPYTWGKNGQVYQNGVALSPFSGFVINYGDVNVGVASEMGRAFTSQYASYYYSMCFNWEGYRITLDPTFISLYNFMVIDTDSGFKISAASAIAILSVLSISILVLKKRTEHQR